MGVFDDFKWTDPGYEAMRAKAIALSRNIGSNQVTEALNKGASGGAVSGIANPGGLAADTMSRFAESRSRSTLDTFNQYTLPMLNSKDNFEQNKQQMEMQAEMAKPGFLDWLNVGISAAGSIINPLGALGFLDDIFKPSGKKGTDVNLTGHTIGRGLNEGGGGKGGVDYPGRLPGRGRHPNSYGIVPDIDPRYRNQS